MIRVLVVDDSAVQREIITHILQSDPLLQVIDTAVNGLEAIRKIEAKRPDIVIMDIHMPKMSGTEAIKNIMSIHPLPIIVVSSSCYPYETHLAFDAIEAGALAILDKAQFVPERYQEIIDTVKLMSEVKVVRRYPHLMKAKNPESVLKLDIEKPKEIQLIGIGASTGGPNVLQDIFDKLRTPFPPILVVQHIPATFLEGLIDWLIQSTKQQIRIAANSDVLEKDWIYFAPCEQQIGVETRLSELVVRLSQSTAENGHRPSASFLFRAMAKVIPQYSLGILLTGMGRDGADGLKVLRDRGGVTIAQDEKSSMIYGMPAEAVALGAAKYVLDPHSIAEFVNNIDREKR